MINFMSFFSHFQFYENLIFPKKFFDRLKAKVIHIGISPYRRHIPNSSLMVFLNFVYLRNDGSNQPISVKSVHSLEPVQILSFLALNSPFLKRFYIIIDNYINELKNTNNFIYI